MRLSGGPGPLEEGSGAGGRFVGVFGTWDERRTECVFVSVFFLVHLFGG